jgi:HNH endonuclease
MVGAPDDVDLTLVERLAYNQIEMFYMHWYCHYCMAPLIRPGDPPLGNNDHSEYWVEHDGRRFKLGPMPATIDHIVPRSRGGSDDEANLVLCCQPCNSIKGNRPAWMFEAITKEWMWRNRHFMLWIRLEWTKFYPLRMNEREHRYNMQQGRRLRSSTGE